VSRLIAAAGNLKHQTALAVAYGAGLRAGEVVALKVGATLVLHTWGSSLTHHPMCMALFPAEGCHSMVNVG